MATQPTFYNESMERFPCESIGWDELVWKLQWNGNISLTEWMHFENSGGSKDIVGVSVCHGLETQISNNHCNCIFRST